MLTDAEFTKKRNQLDLQIDQLELDRRYIDNKLKILRSERDELSQQQALHRFKNRPNTSEWIQQFDWSKKIFQILKESFKFDQFKPNQLAAINATLSKKDAIVVMPTGGGKSLIYQLPALLTKNLTIVISPLISLIEDQLMALENLGMSAATVNSTCSKQEKNRVLNDMKENKVNLLYITPEMFVNSKLFLNYLDKCYQGKHLDRIVVDEVHCVSQWGHDFRSDYLHLSIIKKSYSETPILGLTATATSKVLIDVQNTLGVQDSVIITAPYNRPNLFYKVVNKDKNKEMSLKYLTNLITRKYADKSGIIYAGTQSECESIALGLKENGIKVNPYHANLETSVKSNIHKKWMKNKYQLIVATIAFGMGINKPDVRYVIHYTIPKSIEGLYQETGRAGRDDQESNCILMFNLSDALRNISMSDTNTEEGNAMAMLQYALDIDTCRRKLYSKYFDDNWRPTDCEKMCDHCRYLKNITTYNIYLCLNTLLSIIDLASNTGVKLTLNKLVCAWFQTGPKNIQVQACPKPQIQQSEAEYIIGYLIVKKFLKVDRGYTSYSTLAYIVQAKETVDKKTCEGQILMPYPGQLKGVPVHVVEVSPAKSLSCGTVGSSHKKQRLHK